MADEASIVCTLTFTKNGMSKPIAMGGTFTVTVSGDTPVCTVKSIGYAAAEAIDVGEITVPGYLIIHNLDATNYVKIKIATGATTFFARVQPGKWALIPLDPTDAAAPFIIASTAACLVEYCLLPA